MNAKLLITAGVSLLTGLALGFLLLNAAGASTPSPFQPHALE